MSLSVELPGLMFPPGDLVCPMVHPMAHPRGRETPSRETASRGRHSGGRSPFGGIHFGGRIPIVLTSSGSHQSRQYASYWNAFLFDTTISCFQLTYLFNNLHIHLNKSYDFFCCQCSCGKVMFSQVSVCPQRGLWCHFSSGCLVPCSFQGGGCKMSLPVSLPGPIFLWGLWSVPWSVLGVWSVPLSISGGSGLSHGPSKGERDPLD